MARPIAPTPSLDAKSWHLFLKRVDRDLKKPVGPVPTPKIDQAIKMIMADANKQEDSNGSKSE